MAIRQVLRMGHPLLLQVAQSVSQFNTRDLDKLIADMFDTMAAQNGAGLAAPQIAVSQRLVIFGVESNPRYPDVEPVPTSVLINPEIRILGKDTDAMWEGCLSVPGMRGLVERYTHIRYSGYDQHGNRFEREAHGFHARVVQHECDHLDGILYPRRIKDLRLFGFSEELLSSMTDVAVTPDE